MVFWIHRTVPEPETWAKADPAVVKKPGAPDLSRGFVRSVTLRTTLVRALDLSAWWLFLFWQTRHLRKVLVDAGTPASEITQLVSAAFFAFNVASVLGNFGAGWLAQKLGYHRSIAALFLSLGSTMVRVFIVPVSLPRARGFGCRSAACSGS
jgi:MFS family permease